jgi:hypothetical protein
MSATNETRCGDALPFSALSARVTTGRARTPGPTGSARDAGVGSPLADRFVVGTGSDRRSPWRAQLGEGRGARGSETAGRVCAAGGSLLSRKMGYPECNVEISEMRRLIAVLIPPRLRLVRTGQAIAALVVAFWGVSVAAAGVARGVYTGVAHRGGHQMDIALQVLAGARSTKWRINVIGSCSQPGIVLGVPRDRDTTGRPSAADPVRTVHCQSPWHDPQPSRYLPVRACRARGSRWLRRNLSVRRGVELHKPGDRL